MIVPLSSVISAVRFSHLISSKGLIFGSLKTRWYLKDSSLIQNCSAFLLGVLPVRRHRFRPRPEPSKNIIGRWGMPSGRPWASARGQMLEAQERALGAEKARRP